MLKFETLKHNFPLALCHNKELLIANFEKEDLNFKGPDRAEMEQLIWVKSGILTLSINYVPYELKEGNIIIIETFDVIRHLGSSEDLKGVSVWSSYKYLEQLKSKNSSISVFEKINVKGEELVLLNKSEEKILSKCISNLEEVVLRTKCRSKEALLSNLIALLLIEVSEMYLKRGFTLSSSSRRDDIMKLFLSMLRKNFKKEHSVAFYAERLFITSQYLTLVVKEVTGMTAGQYIEQALLEESKRLLKIPGIKACQISEILHFVDPSSFGRFFKKKVGVSPIEYQKKLGF